MGPYLDFKNKNQKSPRGPPESIHMKGLSPIWPRRLGCRGGATVIEAFHLIFKIISVISVFYLFLALSTNEAANTKNLMKRVYNVDAV